MTGSIIAQITAIIVSPIMTRIYTESQIGEYTLILTAITMFGSVICGRYDMSIVTEEDEKNVYPIIKLCLYVTLVASGLVAIGYTIYLYLSDDLVGNLGLTFLSIFVLLVLAGVGYILMSYNNRNKDYKIMASVSVVREIGKGATLIGLGLLKAGSLGLLCSYLVGSALGLNKQAKKLKENRDEFKEVNDKQITFMAKKYVHQPLYSVPALFANNFSYSSLNLFINSMFGTVELAYYSMSYRMLGIPLTLVSGNVSKAFFEKASRECEGKGDFRKSFLETTFLTLMVAIPMVVVLMLLAPLLFEIFFGNSWRRAGEFVVYLAPMFGIRLVVSTLTPTMIICNKQNYELIMQSLFMISAITIFIVCKQNATIEQFLILISIVYSVIYLIFYIVMFKLTKKGKGEKQK